LVVRAVFGAKRDSIPKIMIPRTGKQWLLPVLVVLCTLCLFFAGGKSTLPVNAHAQPQSDTEDEILVIPIQLERDSYGLAMVDTVNQTLWIYELNSRGPAHNRLKLLAARSWQYDRLLQQYNTAEPKPAQVKKLLENLGQWQSEQNRAKQQDSEANTLQVVEPNNRDFDD